MTHFQRQSIREIKGARGKLKRAFLQFTPAKWHTIQWPARSYTQAVSIFLLIFLFQLSELNTVLLQAVFGVPSRHHLTFLRLTLLCLIAAPSVRQYYTYVLDNRTSKRLGTQSWLCIAILATELLICIKFGIYFLSRMTVVLVLFWVIAMVVFTIACVGLIMAYTPSCSPGQSKPKRKRKRRKRRVYAVEDHNKSD